MPSLPHQPSRNFSPISSREQHLAASSLLSAPSKPHWFFNSGATHHVTHDEQVLQQPIPYSGSDTLSVESGNQLSISSTGNGILPLPSSSLFLKNVLYVLTMSHNLFSVYQLTNHSNCSLTFDSKGVVV